METKQRLNDLVAALQTLSEAKRVVLVMAEIEELSCAQIASCLQIPIGTV
jgi:DNA-directed RNA polymerase specialized sigma24 family protein